MGAVASFAAVDVGGFAYAGGWLRPDALTPGRFTDRFEKVYGHHDGFRRNHAKGLSATGTFESNGAGAAICRATVFQPGTVAVIARFSLGGGLPDQADKPDTVRGLGLMFQTSDGQQWRTAMINLPVFTDSTPEGFYERLLASKPQPDTGKPDPHLMAAFLDRHPETAAAMKIIKQTPPSAGFADSTFNGLNAFQVHQRRRCDGSRPLDRPSDRRRRAGQSDAIAWKGLSVRRPHPRGGAASVAVAPGPHNR